MVIFQVERAHKLTPTTRTARLRLFEGLFFFFQILSDRPLSYLEVSAINITHVQILPKLQQTRRGINCLLVQHQPGNKVVRL